MNKLTRMLLLCALLMAIGGTTTAFGQLKRKRPNVVSPPPTDDVLPLDEGFFYDGFYIESLVDMSANQYHNLSLLPREYLMFVGVGIGVPFLRSGRDVAMGGTFQVKYGRSLTLERVTALSVPMYLTARFGSNSQLHSQAEVGLGVGFGAEYYLNIESGIGVKEKELRPAYFVEVSGSILGKNAFLRYGQMITSGFVTKSSIQFGMFIGIESD